MASAELGSYILERNFFDKNRFLQPERLHSDDMFLLLKPTVCFCVNWCFLSKILLLLLT